MVFAHLPLNATDPAVEAFSNARELSCTERTLLEAVAAVRNLRDEDDVQCLMFLAGELGILQHSPFYFSRASVEGTPVPHSLVLQATLHTLMAQGLIRRESGILRVETWEGEPEPAGMSWLGMLQPYERRALTEATLELHGCGRSVTAQSSEIPFRRAVARALDGEESAEASERRLGTVRRQLSLV